MKYKLFFLVFTLTACATSKDYQQATSCKVWKDEIPFGPTAVDVGDRGAYWSGQCKNLWWGCKSVSTNIELNKEGKKEVFLYISESEEKISWGKENASIGSISGDEFKDAQENMLEKVISLSPMKADSVSKTVSYTANLHFLGTTSKVTYYFNNHCSNEQALLGALAVSAVSRLSSNNQQPK